MTKKAGLLTVEDVRRFINDAVKSVKPTIPHNYKITKEIMKVFGVSKNQMKVFVQKGIPTHRIGTRNFYDVDEVREWLEENSLLNKQGV